MASVLSFAEVGVSVMETDPRPACFTNFTLSRLAGSNVVRRLYGVLVLLFHTKFQFLPLIDALVGRCHVWCSIQSFFPEIFTTSVPSINALNVTLFGARKWAASR